jgi:single-stranded-DNA-specific exonuclease
MARSLGVSEVLARAMINRGVTTKSAAAAYLNPSAERLSDASLLPDVGIALSVTLDAVKSGVRIAVYGDYDCDGVTSSVILVKALRRLGADADYYIPSRETEGFGLNRAAVARLSDSGVGLLITVDNGIAAIDEIRLAKSLGMGVVVLDHHEPGFADEGGVVLPDADAVVDPKRPDSEYPFRSLCAAGLALRFVSLLPGGGSGDMAREFFALAALATVCDVVELTGENRIIVRAGLDVINSGDIPNIGLSALIAARFRNLPDAALGAYELGFVVGPCVNAAGRLETAELAARLFMTDDPEEAGALSERLAGLNEERKSKTETCVARALASLPDPPDKIIVALDPEAHESVAGIAAGRIREALGRPALVLTRSAEDGFVKGSARSVPAYNIFEGLSRCRDMFERFGGHAMAAGLTMAETRVDELRERLNAECALSDDDLIPRISADMSLPFARATFALAVELRRMEPFGKGNERPVFGAKGVRGVDAEIIGGKRTTLRFSFRDGARPFRAVCFGMLERFVSDLGAVRGADFAGAFGETGRCQGLTMDFLYCLSVHEYNGNEYLDIKITDFRVIA